MGRSRGRAMTEGEWLASTDPEVMLGRVRNYKPPPIVVRQLPEPRRDRKLRLFAAACCRHVWLRIPIAVKDAIQAVELFVDGRLGSDVFRVATIYHPPVAGDESNESGGQISRLMRGIGYFNGSLWHADHVAAIDDLSRACAELGTRYPFERTRNVHADLLRDIFGNPFRPVTFDETWRTTTARQLAQQMYDSRDFSAMPILADALQDAGCENADILDHCRGPGPHVRGCWVVDLVLGKS